MFFGKFDVKNQSKFCKSLSSFRGVINRPADLPVSPRGFGRGKTTSLWSCFFLRKNQVTQLQPKNWRMDSKKMMLWLENVSLHSSVDIFGIYLEFRGCMLYIYICIQFGSCQNTVKVDNEGFFREWKDHWTLLCFPGFSACPQCITSDG